VYRVFVLQALVFRRVRIPAKGRLKMLWSIRPSECVQQLDNGLMNFPRKLIFRHRAKVVGLFHFRLKPAKISDTSGENVGSF